MNRPDPSKGSGRWCPTCGVEEPHYWYDVEPMYDEMWLRVSTTYRPGAQGWLRSVYEASKEWGAHEGLNQDQQTLEEYVRENMEAFKQKWLRGEVFTYAGKGRHTGLRKGSERHSQL